MDTIQKVLVNAGRKDLAQKYYKKFAKNKINVIVTAYFDHTIQNKKTGVKSKIFGVYSGYNGKADLKEETNSVLEFKGYVYRNLKDFEKDISRTIKSSVTNFDVYE